MAYWLARMYHRYHEPHYWEVFCTKHNTTKVETNGDLISEEPKCSQCGSPNVESREISYEDYNRIGIRGN